MSFAVVLVGIVIGMMSGFFGLGGALVATPMLKLFAGLPALLALGSPLPAAIPSALSGAVSYYRAGLLDGKTIAIILSAALPFNVIGSYSSSLVNDHVLMVATACVMVYASVTFLVRGWLMKESAHHPKHQSVTQLIMIGVATGLLSGFLAIGGGIIIIPAFVKILRTTVKEAMAVSLVCVAALAIPGTIVHAMVGHIDWTVACVLGVVSIPTAYYGSRISVRLRNRTIERAYGMVMLCFAIYFLWTLYS
ncbi:MAG: sulfite exporter TauE/SafE family protein [Candidatus Kapabacteria bacterium]|nr:sulfite exporter TauE/SafE family protein [Candidatus Kapabacteria bacterium]